MRNRLRMARFLLERRRRPPRPHVLAGIRFRRCLIRRIPSGEVALVASTVAPFVFEYGRDHPMVYGLELLTLYDMVAR